MQPADIYLIDEPSAYLDSEQRIVAAKVIKRFILHAKKTTFVVEHDFIMATYLADRVIVYEGQPSIDCVANAPQSLLTGMNLFLSVSIEFCSKILTILCSCMLLASSPSRYNLLEFLCKIHLYGFLYSSMSCIDPVDWSWNSTWTLLSGATQQITGLVSTSLIRLKTGSKRMQDHTTT